MARRSRIRSTRSGEHADDGRHRFEHWDRDNTVYFITAKCRDHFAAFGSEEAKRVFWDRFDHWTAYFGFVPWITSLLSNHYHKLGYLKVGENLGTMMQRIHGSVAKLVNDLLPERHLPSGASAVDTTISTGACGTNSSAGARTGTRFDSACDTDWFAIGASIRTRT